MRFNAVCTHADSPSEALENQYLGSYSRDIVCNIRKSGRKLPQKSFKSYYISYKMAETGSQYGNEKVSSKS